MFLDVSCTIDDMTGTNWKRLAEVVTRRRIELGMKTATALAERADLTPRVIGDLENARRENYGPGTKAQIESALRWEPGSIDQVLAGGSPIYKMVGAEAFKELQRARREAMTPEEREAADERGEFIERALRESHERADRERAGRGHLTARTPTGSTVNAAGRADSVSVGHDPRGRGAA